MLRSTLSAVLALDHNMSVTVSVQSVQSESKTSSAPSPLTWCYTIFFGRATFDDTFVSSFSSVVVNESFCWKMQMARCTRPFQASFPANCLFGLQMFFETQMSLRVVVFLNCTHFVLPSHHTRAGDEDLHCSCCLMLAARA